MGKLPISPLRKQQLKLAKQFLTKGMELWSAYDYEEALVEMRQALVIREAVLGKFSKNTAKTYFSMGCAHHFNSKYSLALICLRRTLRIHLHKANANHKHKQQTLIQSTKDYITWCLKKKNGATTSDEQCELYIAKLVQAVHHEQQGDALASESAHDGALQAYNLALQEETSAVGTTHIDIADLYVKIADVLIFTANDDQDPFCYYRKAVAIYTEALGHDHPYTQTTLEKMDTAAVMAPSKQQPSQSSSPSKQQQNQRAVVSKAKKNIGIAPSRQELVISDKATNLVDKAVKRFHRDLVEFRKQHHNNTTTHYHNSDGQYFWMGLGLYKHHQYAEALVAFRRVWRIRTRLYGRDHGHTQQVLQTMTLILKRIQMTQRSRTTTNQYQQDLCIAVDAESNGDALVETGHIGDALREYQRAATLEASAVGTRHLEYAALQDKIGDCYFQALQLQLAINDGNDDGNAGEDNDNNKAMTTKSYRIALLIYTSALGRGHPVTKRIIQKMEAVCET
jgi:tetratricopeptide (TPR) repeat protein